MLSILIPLRDEFDNLDNIVDKFDQNLQNINYEVILINDFSSDKTFEKAKSICSTKKNYKIYNNEKKGLGGALSLGIEKVEGKYTCIMMADLSDDINDLKSYYKEISENKLDAIFGSRFMSSSEVKNYPFGKLILNRIFNFFVSFLFFNSYTDFTNAFKIYKSDVLKNFLPLISESFNIFLEMPLKIISRKYKYKIIPINWHARKRGKAKFNIKELRSKYLFTLIYCFIEKILLNKKK
jgi:glycosyltransferase involved in cell wall biosynthesis